MFTIILYSISHYEFYNKITKSKLIIMKKKLKEFFVVKIKVKNMLAKNKGVCTKKTWREKTIVNGIIGQEMVMSGIQNTSLLNMNTNILNLLI